MTSSSPRSGTSVQDVAPWSDDAAQQRALAHRGGTLLVLGAPATGKSAVVVRQAQSRMAEGASPDEVLVLGPTRQGAARLRAAIGRGLGSTYTEPLARTPSSLAFSVLRITAAAAGEPLPRLISGAEQDVVLRELLAGHAELGIGPQWPEHLWAALPTAGFRGQLRDLLMRAVEHGVGPGDLRDLAERHERPEWAAAAEVLEEYDQVTALSDPGSYDPAWICTAAADQLEEDEDLLEHVRSRLRAVLVDDAQELTASAARLLRVLHRPGIDLVLAGDPDVTSLGFRGAVPGRFVELAEQTGGAEQVVLRTRHQGAPELLEATARVADRIGAVHSTGHRRPDLGPRPLDPVQPGSTPASPLPTGSDGPEDAGLPADLRVDAGQGRKTLEVAVARSRAQEHAYVARWLRSAHLLDGVPWDQMVVIARSSAQQDAVRRALSSGGVAVRVDRSRVPLGQDPAVSPLLLAFDVVTRHPEVLGAPSAEESVALLTSPLGGVDPVTLRRLRRRVRVAELEKGGGRGADEVLAALLVDPDLQRTPSSGRDPDLDPVVRVGEVLAAGAAVAARGGSAEEVLWALWDASRLASSWTAQALDGGALGARADRDLDAVLVLFAAAETFVERLPGARSRSFLDQVRSSEVASDTLVQGARPGAAVEVLTAQAAAGRQWRQVAVVGVQDGVWPDLRLRDSLLGAEALVAVLRGLPGSGPEAVRASQAQVRADELRQFHVAVSRASARLLVTAVASTDDQPSGFLDLVDPDYREQPPLEVPPAATLRGMVGRLRREAVVAQREGRHRERDIVVDALLALAAEGVAGADPARWWDTRTVSAPARRLVEEGPVRVSPSRVQTYLDCSLRWFLTTRGTETGEAAAAELGTLVHGIVEERPDADGPELVREVDRRWAELGLRPGWVSERDHERARAMVTRYADYVREAQAQGRSLVGVEQPFTTALVAENGQKVVLSGTVDRLERDEEGRLLVNDLKTSKSKPSAEDMKTHAQLGAYQVAVEAGAFEDLQPGARSGGAQLVNLGTPERVLTSRQLPLSEAEDPQWARRLVVEAGTGMAGREFPARDQGSTCRLCPARFCCPLQPEGQQR